METSRSIQKEIDTVRGPSRTDGTRQRCQRRVSGFCGPVLCCFATFPEMPEEPSIAIVRPVIAGAGSPSSSGLAASMPSVGFASNSRDSRPPPGRTPSVSNRDLKEHPHHLSSVGPVAERSGESDLFRSIRIAFVCVASLFADADWARCASRGDRESSSAARVRRSGLIRCAITRYGQLARGGYYE
jgi:hypothetical protein